MTIFFYFFDTWMVFAFFQYKSNWINPSRKISPLIKRNFEVRNNISKKYIQKFCNFLFIIYDFILLNQHYHCVKSVRIRNFSGPYFPAFGLNTERYSVSLQIQFKCEKEKTRKTPNTDTSHAVYFWKINHLVLEEKVDHFPYSFFVSFMFILCSKPQETFLKSFSSKF